MGKLKSKVFWVVFLILTVFTTSVLCFYNAQLYSSERSEINRNLSQAEKIGEERIFPFGNSDFIPDDDFGNIRYMDKVVYTVLLNNDNSVAGIISHSDEEIDSDAISEIITEVTENGVQHKIGSLYSCRYSYSASDNAIVIIDNENTNSLLLGTLLISISLLILLELIIFLISRKITSWIIKPVEESFDKQKQFIADASHELKTPLAVIMASCDALESNPDEAKWLENIKSESDRMNKLISDLLELAKSEAVDDRSEFIVGNLSKTVEKSVLTFEGIMFEKGITLDYSIEDNPFFHPLYLMRYGFNKPKCNKVLGGFMMNY